MSRIWTHLTAFDEEDHMTSKDTSEGQAGLSPGDRLCPECNLQVDNYGRCMTHECANVLKRIFPSLVDTPFGRVAYGKVAIKNPIFQVKQSISDDKYWNGDVKDDKSVSSISDKAIDPPAHHPLPPSPSSGVILTNPIKIQAGNCLFCGVAFGEKHKEDCAGIKEKQS